MVEKSDIGNYVCYLKVTFLWCGYNTNVAFYYVAFGRVINKLYCIYICWKSFKFPVLQYICFYFFDKIANMMEHTNRILAIVLKTVLKKLKLHSKT